MIKFILVALLMTTGVLIFIISVAANFRFGSIMNRLQISGNSDTLGCSFILAGLIIAEDTLSLTLKLLIMLLFMWFANPVASHMLAKTEVTVNPNALKDCEVIDRDDG
ncbi:MAG: monovalent cation/H(+) antiporter subunit G [Eubacteriales bacterium]